MSDKNRARPDNWYRRLIARFYDRFLADLESRVLTYKRSELVGGLQGKILEIGAGTGANFPHYPAGTSVLAIEPSAAMLAYAKKKLQEHHISANIELLQAGVGDTTVAERLPPGSLDAIVCTLVLCTVPNPEAAIRNFHSWLKPDGRLYVLEHIQAADQPTQFIHNLANPLWKHLADGCHLNRTTDQALRAQGFEPIWEKYFTKGLPFYQAVMKKA